MMQTSIIAAMLIAAGTYITGATEASEMAYGDSMPQQSPGILDRFIAELASSSAIFDYEYVLDNTKVKMTGSGNVFLQGSSFIMKGDGLEVYCDGSVKWTIDRNASEAVAESFDREHPDYLANPALIVGNVSRAFSSVSEKPSSFGDKPATAISLAPLPGLKGISSAVLYLSGAESPVPAGLEMTMSDGSFLRLTVTSFSLSPAIAPASFTFNEKSLSTDFVITDLR